MSIQQNQIVQPTYNGQDIYYRTPVDAIITDGMSLDDYIRNTTGVVESGENSNGSYIKFADGTMICYNIVSGSGTRYDYWSNFDRISPTGFSFPKTFFSIPSVQVTVEQQASISAYSENITVSGFGVTIVKPKNTSNNNYKFKYVAVGRWKDYDASVLPDAQQSTIINSSSTNYSSEERVIGLWTDGRPLYRKTFNLGNLPNNATKYVASGLPYQGISIKNTYGNCRRASDGYQPPINHVRLNNETAQISGFMGSNGNIEITTGTDRSGMTSEITLEYTKDSDSPVTSQTKDLLTVVNGKNITDLETIIQQRVDQVIADRLSLNDAYWVGWARSNVSLSAGSSLWTNMTTSKSKNVTYSNNVLTVNKSGLYFFKAFTHWGSTQQGGRHFIDVSITGGSPSTKVTTRSEDDEYQTGDPVVTCTELFYLQAGATITLSVYSSGSASFYGSDTNGLNASGVYLYKIGDYLDI